MSRNRKIMFLDSFRGQTDSWLIIEMQKFSHQLGIYNDLGDSYLKMFNESYMLEPRGTNDEIARNCGVSVSTLDRFLEKANIIAQDTLKSKQNEVFNPSTIDG